MVRSTGAAPPWLESSELHGASEVLATTAADGAHAELAAGRKACKDAPTLSQVPQPDLCSAPGVHSVEHVRSLAQRTRSSFSLHPPVSAVALQSLGPGASATLSHLVFSCSHFTTVSESRALIASKTSTTIGIRGTHQRSTGRAWMGTIWILRTQFESRHDRDGVLTVSRREAPRDSGHACTPRHRDFQDRLSPNDSERHLPKME